MATAEEANSRSKEFSVGKSFRAAEVVDDGEEG